MKRLVIGTAALAMLVGLYYQGIVPPRTNDTARIGVVHKAPTITSEPLESDPTPVPTVPIVSSGDIIFPTTGDVVSVDPYFEDFKVVVLPGDAMDTVYTYYFKTYTTLPANIPSDPTTVGAVQIGEEDGDYLYEYAEDLDHEVKHTSLKKKYLVVWEGTQDLDPYFLIPIGPITYTNTSLTYYPHSTNLDPLLP